MKPQRSDFEFLAHQDTPIGTLILRRGELPGAPGQFVTEITIDHEFLMSSHITYSERALSRIALEMHPGKALRVLVGGLDPEAAIFQDVIPSELVKGAPEDCTADASRVHGCVLGVLP